MNNDTKYILLFFYTLQKTQSRNIVSALNSAQSSLNLWHGTVPQSMTLLLPQFLVMSTTPSLNIYISNKQDLFYHIYMIYSDINTLFHLFTT